MMKKLLKLEGCTFVESGGIAHDTQIMCAVNASDNATIGQALQIAAQIRQKCSNIRIDDNPKSAPLSAAIKNITMSSIVCHTAVGDVLKWECCVHIKPIDSSGAYFGTSAETAAQIFINNISI